MGFSRGGEGEDWKFDAKKMWEGAINGLTRGVTNVALLAGFLFTLL